MEIVRNSFLFLFSDFLLEKCEGFLELYKFPGKKERKKKCACIQCNWNSPAGSGESSRVLFLLERGWGMSTWVD